ncbi:MAG: anti-sigma factor [Ignavibacteriae bacterium]|nr:anti-sigma factor [Ignavibacteriota bacterium]MCB9214707.1 anti-sigma factor [Ignavibacteria bacterium]
MNIKEYIESGVLELYAMGALPPEERAQVESDLATYPELRAELQEISDAVESIAPVPGIEPRADLRDSIIDLIGEKEEKQEEKNIISYQPEIPSRSNGRTWLLAASFIGLIISSGAALLFWIQLGKAEEQLAESIDIQERLASSVEQARDEIQTLRNYENRVVRMASTGKIPEAFAVVYWDPHSRTVWIDAAKMPPLPDDKQYQLWAIADGDPVDAGLFDGNTLHLQELKDVSEAKTFAVTVEPKGGSKRPTLETMTVVGQL